MSGNRSAGAYVVDSSDQYINQDSLLKLSPRQIELNRRYSWYRTEQYDSRNVEWDGSKRLSHVDREQFAHAAAQPAGWKDFGRSVPLRFRRPAVVYHLVRIIVNKFTAMLFSENRHPTVSIAGDEATNDYVKALIECSRFWAKWKEARGHGGSMGTAIVGFKFVAGVPRLEVFDPRWARPTFIDREAFELGSLDIRYPFDQEKRDQNGKWVVEKQWHRRYIDDKVDVVFKPLPVTQEEPRFWPVKEAVEHNLGFCAAQWVQNHPVGDDIDGEPDVVGSALDNNEAVDGLLSQAQIGTQANCFGRETRFVTSSGVRSFDDFNDGDPVEAMSHTGNWRHAVVRKFGRQKMFAITLQRGTRGAPVVMRTTRDHRWILEDGTTTDHVEVGDRLMSAPSSFSDFDYSQASPDERAMWCRGFVWGDGSATTSGSRVRLCGAKSSYAVRFMDCGFRVSSPAWADGDIVASGPLAKSLPPSDAPLHLLRAFVRGYVDADGTKSDKKSSRWKRIQVTGTESVRFVRTVFPAVGLYIAGEVDMTGTSTNYGMRTAETVRFSLNENANTSPNSTWRVAAIEPLDEDETWCLVVDIDQSFALPCGVVTRNCDPTTIVKTNEPLAAITKGSDNAIKVETAGDVKYLELTGSGPKAATDMAMQLKDIILEASSCVLERPDDIAKTATEIMRRYESMTAAAATMREQYADFGIKPLIRKMATASRVLTSSRPRVIQVPHNANMPESTAAIDSPKAQGSTTAPDGDPDTKVVQGQIFLPPKIDVDPATGKERLVPLKIGPGPMDVVRVQWPQFFEATPTDAQAASAAATAALTAKLLDKRSAASYLAPYFKVEDVDAMLRRIEGESSSDSDMLNAAMGGAPAPGPEDQSPPAPGSPPKAPNAPPTQGPPQAPQAQPQQAPNGAPAAQGWGVLGAKS